jgi:hypothetical protein
MAHAAGIPQSDSQTNPQTSLYEQDFVAWCEDTVAKLKAQKFSELDLENLIEEIDSLARSDKRQLQNRLDVLLNHLLKRCYVPTPENYRGWEVTIREQRKQLQRLLKDSPSLRSYWQEVFEQIWQTALADACEDYPQVEFPAECPFDQNIEAILTQVFWQSSDA